MTGDLILDEGFLTYEKFSKIRAALSESEIDDLGDLSDSDLSEFVKAETATLAKAEGDEPGEEEEKLEPGDINPETGEEVPEELEEEEEPEEEGETE